MIINYSFCYSTNRNNIPITTNYRTEKKYKECQKQKLNIFTCRELCLYNNFCNKCRENEISYRGNCGHYVKWDNYHRKIGFQAVWGK